MLCTHGGWARSRKSENRNHRARVVDGKAIFPVTIGDQTFVKWPSLRLIIHQELRTEKWEALQVLKQGYMIEGEIPAVSVMITAQDVSDVN